MEAGAGVGPTHVGEGRAPPVGFVLGREPPVGTDRLDATGRFVGHRRPFGVVDRIGQAREVAAEHVVRAPAAVDGDLRCSDLHEVVAGQVPDERIDRGEERSVAMGTGHVATERRWGIGLVVVAQLDESGAQFQASALDREREEAAPEASLREVEVHPVAGGGQPVGRDEGGDAAAHDHDGLAHAARSSRRNVSRGSRRQPTLRLNWIRPWFGTPSSLEMPMSSVRVPEAIACSTTVRTRAFIGETGSSCRASPQYWTTSRPAATR